MKQQLYFYLGALLLWPLLPLLYVQGRRVRREVPQLPEAGHNILGAAPGAEPALSLLAIGESTIAGVGVTDHRDGITGQLAQAIGHSTGRAVRWQVLARSGYTAERVNAKLVARIPAVPFDFVLIGLGANDTFTLRSPLAFRRHLRHLLARLAALQPQAKVVIANLPPVGQFPAFPGLMRFVLGGLVRLHGAVIRKVPQQFANVYYVDQPIEFAAWSKRADASLGVADFFSDGVHPSALTYSIWGQEIGDFMAVRKII